LRVRVIACAKDLTDEILATYSGKVRRDETLPKSVCTVEIFLKDGAIVIGYTLYINIV
jgi:hypothetical protein